MEYFKLVEKDEGCSKVKPESNSSGHLEETLRLYYRMELLRWVMWVSASCLLAYGDFLSVRNILLGVRSGFDLYPYRDQTSILMKFEPSQMSFRPTTVILFSLQHTGRRKMVQPSIPHLG